VAPFEGFQIEPTEPTEPTESTKLLTNLQAAINRVQITIESLVELTDSTCAIVQEVEQGYVGSKSAPDDDIEYTLPEDEQIQRKQSRQDRSKKAFATNRRIHAATQGTVPLECFQNVSDYDTSLREYCVQLHTLMENAETQLQIRNIQRIEADLEFIDRQLNKAEGFQTITTTPPTPTHIYSSLYGKELESAAKGLLAKELTLHTKIVQLQQKTTIIRDRIGRVYRKANMVTTGNYNL
jgi:hypothetical protein